MVDVCVIGGGLAGLVSCLRITERYPNLRCIVIEKRGRLGGRVKTEWDEDKWLDRGASRIHKNMHLMMNLLRELRLEHKLRPLPSRNPINFVQKSGNVKVVPFEKIVPKNNEKTYNEYSSKIDEYAKNVNRGLYKNFKMTGYGEILDMTSGEGFSRGDLRFLLEPNGWFELEGGWTQVIDALKEKLKQKNTQFLLGWEVKEAKFTKSWEIVAENLEKQEKRIKSSVMIWGVPPVVPGIFDDLWGNNWESESLLRVFVRSDEFKREDVRDWLGVHEVLIREGCMGQCLVRHDNIIEWIYTAGNCSRQIMTEYIENPAKMKLEWQKNWEKMGAPSIDWGAIPDEGISLAFWDAGVYYWQPNSVSIVDRLNNMRTWFLERNGYLVGDSYSFLPGWMEGALESIDALFQQKGGKKRGKYTLQEVSKHNTREDGWMVIRGRVYDVTDWIPLHPGGDAILAGLGKDATTLFENVHPNLMLPEKMLKRYYIGDVRKN